MRKEASFAARALPSHSRDLSLLRQNDSVLRGGVSAAPVVPASEPVLRSLPSVAVSPAQVTAV